MKYLLLCVAFTLALAQPVYAQACKSLTLIVTTDTQPNKIRFSWEANTTENIKSYLVQETYTLNDGSTETVEAGRKFTNAAKLAFNHKITKRKDEYSKVKIELETHLYPKSFPDTTNPHCTVLTLDYVSDTDSLLLDNSQKCNVSNFCDAVNVSSRRTTWGMLKQMHSPIKYILFAF